MPWSTRFRYATSHPGRLPGSLREHPARAGRHRFRFGAGHRNILSTGPVDDLSIVVHGLGAGSPTGPGVWVQSRPTPPSPPRPPWPAARRPVCRLLEPRATQPGATLADLTVTTAGRGRGPAGGRRCRGPGLARPHHRGGIPAERPRPRDRTAVVAGGRHPHLRQTGGPSTSWPPLASHGAGPDRRLPSAWTGACCSHRPVGCAQKRGRLPSAGPRLPRRPRGRHDQGAAPSGLTSTAFTARVRLRARRTGDGRPRHRP